MYHGSEPPVMSHPPTPNAFMEGTAYQLILIMNPKKTAIPIMI